MKSFKQEALSLIERNGHDGAIRHCKQVIAMSPNTFGMSSKTSRYEILLEYISTMRDDAAQLSHNHQQHTG